MWISRGKDLVLRFISLIIPVLTFLYVLITSIAQPLKHMIQQLQNVPPSTPPPIMSSSHASTHAMDCFSDDEADVTVSSSGSSLAAPLDSSSSDRMSRPSVTSTPHLATSSMQFYSPADVSTNTSAVMMESYNYSPMRRPATSPGPMRARARFLARTPGGGGISPGKFQFV